ncbi:dihydrodipicolinate synthase family protein, partial [Spirillospora albida]|uniref:dihydrodipicolinate synthase family protein n=1 Tax=Spirillospora albida TaxID=58123 RepID=UPI0004BEE086
MDGIHASLVTPFTPAGEVDTASLERLASHALRGGASGLVALGTTGEPATLDPEERRTVLEVCRAVSAEHGAPLIVGAGTAGTAASVRDAREAAAYADALLVVVPYHLRPSDDGVIDHFAAIGAAVDVPLLPYNIPYRTGKHLSGDALVRLLGLDRVAGLKHCPGAIDDDTLTLLAARTGKAVLCGDDAYLYPMLRLGASGGITASACLAPETYAALDEAARSGDSSRALALHDALLPLVRALFAEPSPSVLKACLAEAGLIDDPSVRMPMKAPREESVAAAMAALRTL